MLIERAVRYARRQAGRLIGPDPSDLLFRGEDRIFLEAMKGCSVYGEYGCGQSTIWCAGNTDARIISVDSSAAWIATVREAVADPAGLEMVHVDLGELGSWGRPIDYSHRARFSSYIAAPWQFDAKPDVVLVDGRFRVACFLKSLLEAAPGTTILFDDYTERSHYHLVEEYADRTDTCGTQAKFVVPEDFDRESVTRELAAFTYVMD